MATYEKFQQFVEDLAHKEHDFSVDVFKVMLSLVAPVATNSIRGNLTEISAGDGYTTGGETPSVTSSGHTTGTYKLVLADVVWTASAGTFADFRYASLYNDSTTAPADALIGFHDYGSTVDLGAGETFTWDASPSNGILTLA